jgi:hypothetical protein
MNQINGAMCFLLNVRLKGTKLMMWIRIVWAIFINLIVMVIYLGMLSVAHTSFETIVIAGMGLIYVVVVTLGTQIARTQNVSIFFFTERYHKLVKAQNLPIEIDYEEEELKDVAEKFKRMTPVYYINLGFIVFIWLISIWNIIQSLCPNAWTIMCKG